MKDLKLSQPCLDSRYVRPLASSYYIVLGRKEGVLNILDKDVDSACRVLFGTTASQKDLEGTVSQRYFFTAKLVFRHNTLGEST